MNEEIQLTLADEKLVVAAARCRHCGVITWRCSLLAGVSPVASKHHKGCRKPFGRLDLKEIVKTQMPVGRQAAWLQRLDRMLWDDGMRRLADELLAQLGETQR